MECPNCRCANPPPAKFCMECGRDLRHVFSLRPWIQPAPRSYTPRYLIDKILTTRSSIEGERKIVTVLFADVANYTSITEKLDPEEVHRIMDECFRILMDEIHRCEGTINQFTGDGVMALFGAPVTHEDHAERACFAALGIQEALEGYGRHLENSLGIDFRMRLGLNSGPVVVGSIGDDLRMDYSAIGDTTNLASRMERMASPGSILISDKTYEIVKQSFVCKSLGRHTIKGKEEAVGVYRLEAKREVHRARPGVERKIYAAMVGRDRELDQLELQVMKAVNGEGSVVNIIGEAGIGKSRLVAELKKRNVVNRVALLEGRAVSMGRNLSYHPMIDLLRTAAGIKQEDTQTSAFDKLRAALKSVCLEETDEALPFVATMMGMKLSGIYAERVRGIEGKALEKLILKSLRDILARMSQRSPLVILIDDLHWADTSSIELMVPLFRLVESRRVLFVNVFRPGSPETGDRLTKTLRETLPERYVEILLLPLDERMCEVLLAHLLNIRGLHRGLITHIVQRSGGNPFFVEEIVRSLIDQGALVLKDQGYEVTDRIAGITVPISVNDVLMARIDRLDEDSRNLLKVASVIGRNFFHRILSEVLGPVENTGHSLSRLKEVELIREGKRSGEVEYVFKHALAQEAAYASVLPNRRQELHLRTASAIEKLFAERLHEFYGMLAYHYSRAKDLEKAEEYLILAGEEALRSSASHEATHYYQEAMQIYLDKHGKGADLDKVAMLESNIALALYNRGQHEESLAYFDKALGHYWGRLPGNPISTALKLTSALLHFAVALYLPFLKFRKSLAQKDREVFALFYKKCTALAVINPRRFFVESLYLYKHLTRFDLTDFDLGLEIYVAASALFSFPAVSFRISKKILDSVKEEVHRTELRSFTLYDLCVTTHEYLEGHWTAIPGYRPDLVDKDLAIGNIYLASQYLYWQGLASVYQGFLGQARSIAQRLKDISELYANDFSLFLKQSLTTLLLKETYEFDAALAEVEHGIRTARKAGLYLSLMDLYACKALIQVSGGDIQGAGTSLQQADDVRSGVNPAPVQLSEFYRCRAAYYLNRLHDSIRRGEEFEVREYGDKGLQSMKKLLKTTRKVAQYRTESYRLKGTYYWMVGKQRRALRCWRESIRQGERLCARLELLETYSEVGKRLLEPASKYETLDGVCAEEYLEKAKDLMEEMGLQPDSETWRRVAGG